MAETRDEKNLLWVFDAALFLKAFDGIIEVSAGVFVFFAQKGLVLWLVSLVTAGELAHDPNDPVAAFLQSAGTSFAVHTHYLLAAYLVLHGAVKVLLVAGILLKKRSAYPLFMGSLVIFGAYEAYRGFVRHDSLLLVLALFDTVLLVLTAYEYRRRYPRLA